MYVKRQNAGITKMKEEINNFVYFVQAEVHDIKTDITTYLDEARYVEDVVEGFSLQVWCVCNRSGHYLNSILLTFHHQGTALKSAFSTNAQSVVVYIVSRF